MQGSGFLGALIAGIIAGYLVNLLKKINLPMALKSLLPTLIIPIIGVGAIGLIMVYVLSLIHILKHSNSESFTVR